MWFPSVFARYRRGPGAATATAAFGYFPGRYFAKRYFPGRYFPPPGTSSGGTTPTPPTSTITVFLLGRRGHRHPVLINGTQGWARMVWTELVGI